MNRRCRAGHVVDFIEFEVKTGRDVVPQQLEAWIFKEVRYVGLLARVKNCRGKSHRRPHR